MKTIISFLFLSLLFSFAQAQHSTLNGDRACINCPTDEPHESAVLDIQSNKKGILIPRLGDTSLVSNPSTGLLIFNNSTQSFQYYNGTIWIEFGGAKQTAVLGSNNQASGAASTAVGRNNGSEGRRSSTFGYANTAFSDEATAVGVNNDARGDFSTAIGHSNLIAGDFANTFGYDNRANGKESTAIGSNNIAQGDFSSAIGHNNDANEINSNAFGNSNRCNNFATSTFGMYNQASGIGACAFGYRNNADGDYANALGRSNNANEESAFAAGSYCTANRENSSAIGYGAYSNVYGMTAIGSYNTSVGGSNTTWVETDPVFVIGNGEDSNNRSTALTILKNGNIGIGTTSPSDKLEVKGIFRLRNSDNSNSYGMETAEDGDLKFIGDGIVSMVITDVFGRVGIGTELPTHLLSVNGSAGKTGGGSWSTFSDRRLKKNIKPFTDGLEQILQIDPVTYQYNGKAGIKTKETQVGIIAQDIQKIAPYMVTKATYDEEAEKGNENYLVYNPSALDYMFINAFKEQQTTIEEQQENIEAKEQKIIALEKRLERIETILKDCFNTDTDKTEALLSLNPASTSTNAELFQNTPNPFSKQTSISYFIPQNSSLAQIQISDTNGKIWKTFSIKEYGQGQIQFSTTSFTSGTYFYHLILDGQLIDTKKMLFIK